MIIALYFIFVLGIGFMLKKRVKSSSDFLTSGRSIPLWITSLAFISANLGAQEVLGMAASGAKYGMMTSHFYWIGAIPAMVFLGIFMMPFYYGSRARSVPEYLALRFDEKTRGLNAITFAVMTLFSSGVSLYALAILLQSLLGWSFEVSIGLSAGIVMIYTTLGGLTSAIYNEVLQFFLIVLGIAPLVFAGLQRVGGWSGIQSQLPQAMTQVWAHSGHASSNPMQVDAFSMVMGLGFVLSFGYWCTDFLVVQRAMAARDLDSARKTPIIAAIPKIFLPFVVILPGLIAITLMKLGGPDSFSIPIKADGRTDFDMTLPTLLSHFYPSGLLGVGLTALMASFMSGMAGNVTSFNSIFTYDIYQNYFKPKESDSHYLKVGKLATILGVLFSVATAYFARSFNNIMDLLQLVFGFVNAPLFATFLLGMFWKRTTSQGAFFGLLSGTLGAAIVHGLSQAEGNGPWLSQSPIHVFSSAMAQAFGVAIVAWLSCFLVTIGVSLFTDAKPDSELKGLVYSLTDRPKLKDQSWYQSPWGLAVIVMILAIGLNIIFF